MTEAPDEVVALAEQRAAARRDRDFAAADRLREEIAAAGWLVTDTSDGYALMPRPPYDVVSSPKELPDRSGEADSRRATVSLVVDGWPDDVRECVQALLDHVPDDVVVQALDLGDIDGAGAVLHEYAAQPELARRLEVWHVAGPASWSPAAGGQGGHGWAAARTALLRADTARVHVWCDLSTVLTGDALTPLLEAIDADDGVVGAGWRGVAVDLADEWRSFVDAPAGEVDALLGYLLAMRRSTALAAAVPHPKARFYRNADMEASFALREAARAAGGAGRLVVPATDLPVRQGRHRGYHDSDPAYRDAESARTYNRFLQRFRGRTDLLAPRPSS
jgi:hypothetical protein